MRLFIIAGEASGDRLGADLMAGLRAAHPDIDFIGIGGPLMQAEGLDSLIPMDDLSVMGVAEVLPRLPTLLRHISQTAKAAIDARPAALITIDSPDFCLRVANKLRRAAPDIPTIHYVAPSVWAWRPGRAAKMAKVIDHVLALLPFEPPYMEAAGMGCDFVGHPVAHAAVPSAEDVAAWREGKGIAAEDTLLCVLPGSRGGEVARMGPVFRDVLARLSAPVRIVIPTLEPRLEAINAMFGDLTPSPIILTDDAAQKHLAMAAADVALAASGTVALELASVGTPMVIAYDANRLTAALVKRLVKVDAANLVSLLTETRVIPEFLFDACQAPMIAPALDHLIVDQAARQAQQALCAKAMQMLGRGGESTGARAARSVLEVI